MEQVYLFSLLHFIIHVTGEKGQQGQFSFPPTNPLSNSDYTSDKYFSPQFQSQIPYFVTNNYNEMPQKFMPTPNGKLSNNISPVPILITSTANYGDENLRRKDEIRKHIDISSMPFNYNQTKLTNKYDSEDKTSRTTSPLINYNHPIDRMDTTFLASPDTLNLYTANQNPLSKKILLSIENGKNQELEQRVSLHNVNFAPTPNYFLQSTTEPAIPILRLSNEMDLDGSFSYEALGADQTHYVQHSRMENLGTDKEGPVVEGSYSYVGDNGQTYTVHYIADSNGYRATGDHLPVPPPIPEIIQRSIQYNLAEEIKQEPHLKYFNDHISDSNPDNEKNYQNYYRTQRNLFTGQTPEAFSLGFLQTAASLLQNNVTSVKNFTEPLKAKNFQFAPDNIRRNINYEPLGPQVTFRASQGAHSPLNFVQKHTLPQLVNYEPSVKETENAKALWRWQYGINSNTDKPNTLKDSISRSFSEGDDIIINFSEMTPEDYTKTIKDYEKIYSNENYNLINKQETKNYPSYTNMQTNDGYQSFENKKYYSDSYNDIKPVTSTVNDYMLKKYINNNTLYDNYNSNYSRINNKIRPKAIVDEQNGNSISTSTQKSPNWFDKNSKSYDAKETIYNPVDTTSKNTYLKNNFVQTIPIISKQETPNSENSYELKIKSNYENPNVINSILYGNNIQYQEKNQFKSVNDNLQNQITTKNNNNQQVTTPESTIYEEIKNNMFLKNLLMTKDQDPRKLDHKKIQNTENFQETVTRSSPINTFDYEPNSRKEIDPVISKAFDISNVLNLIDNKNIFESDRLLIKRKPQQFSNVNNKYGFNMNSNYESTIKENKEDPVSNIYNIKHPQQQEIRGNLKNYKVLQRNNVRNFNTEEIPSQNLQNKSIYSLNLPTLGRAGPSVKTYHPPLYL